MAHSEYPEVRYRQLLHIQLAGCDAIHAYLRAQFAKGLLNSWGLDHSIKWGKSHIKYGAPLLTHRDIILPEIQRLAAEHKLRTGGETAPVVGVPG